MGFEWSNKHVNIYSNLNGRWGNRWPAHAVSSASSPAQISLLQEDECVCFRKDAWHLEGEHLPVLVLLLWWRTRDSSVTRSLNWTFKWKRFVPVLLSSQEIISVVLVRRLLRLSVKKRWRDGTGVCLSGVCLHMQAHHTWGVCRASARREHLWQTFISCFICTFFLPVFCCSAIGEAY